MLIREGLARLKARGARGCVLVGDPAYYRRFGFRSPTGLVHEGVPPEVFLALPFDGPVPHGEVDVPSRIPGHGIDRRRGRRGPGGRTADPMGWRVSIPVSLRAA